jgi:hypothetical protein
MKLLPVVVGALLLVTSASAQVAVVCNGTESGGNGPRNYWYEVTIPAGVTFEDLEVGTCDPALGNYGAVLAAQWLGGAWVPLPWQWQLQAASWPDHRPKTAHGGGPVAPNGNCTNQVAWWGSPLGAGRYGFGYNHPYRSHDVSWYLSPGVAQVNWNAVVGMGQGPVHGPIPEPASLGLFVLGAVLGLRRRS